MYPDSNYANQIQKQAGAVGLSQQYLPPTLRQQLTENQAVLQAALAKVEAAIAALDANPELETFSNTILAAQNLY